MCIKYIIFALLFGLTQVLCQEDIEIDIDPGVLVKRSSLISGFAATATTNTTTSQEGGGIISLVIQILGGVVQGMLNSQGITNEHVDNALNVFTPQKVHDDLLLFRKALNLGLRFVTFIMRYLPRPSADGGFNPLSLLSSKIAFYNTQPVSENGQFLSFTKLQPVPISPRPDVPERIHQVIDFATQKTPGEETTTEVNESVNNSSQNGDIIFSNNSNSSGSNVQSTTVINITQYVNDSVGGKLTNFNTRYVENTANSNKKNNTTEYPPALSSAKPLPLARHQHSVLPNQSNANLLDDNDVGSDFGQLRSRIVKKAVPPYYTKLYRYHGH